MDHPWDRRLGIWWIADDHPDAPAIAASPSGRRFTYGELAAAANQLSHGLREQGLTAGDTVAYALPNDADVVIWQLATSQIGLRYLALNPSLSIDEFSSILEHSGAAAIVVHQDFADSIDLTRCPEVRLAVSVGGPIDGFVSQESLAENRPDTAPGDRVNGGQIRYSSGTTGKPKGIVRPVSNLEPSAAANAQAIFGRAFRFLPFDGTHLVSTGMHHGGCQGFYLGALNVGQALVILGKFQPEETLKAIEKYGVTTAYMVPTQFVRMLRLPDEVRSSYNLSSLRSVVHSAAPCPLEVKKQMFDWLGPVIWETYGGMEGPATIAKPERWLEKPGTVGRSVRGTRVHILSDDGAELAPGTIGNVYIESAGPRFSYKDDAGLTSAAFTGNSFTIGDIGYLDDDGYLFICDRAKDMIISGGVNIYPAEVEGVLSAHPAVADVAVIGIPDPEWGEQVKAVVELTGGVARSEALAAELIAYTRDRLASYKCPRTVEFRASLPRTETGKLLKRNIRDEFWLASSRNV